MNDLAFVVKGKNSSRKCVERGMVFGKWTVIGDNPHKRRGKVLCRCTCGTKRDVYVENLLNGRSLSCKCRILRPKMIIHQISVKGFPFIQPDQNRRLVVRCECCICGKVFYPAVRDLIAGRYKSCGCYGEGYDYLERCEVARGANDAVHDIPLPLPRDADLADKVYAPSKKKSFFKSKVRNHREKVW